MTHNLNRIGALARLGGIALFLCPLVALATDPPPLPSFFSGTICCVYDNGTNWNNLPFFGNFTYTWDMNQNPPQLYITHEELGFEYVVDGGNGEVYLYDYGSGGWFWTTPTVWPAIYDFNPSVNAWLRYYSDPLNPGHYTSNPRMFWDDALGYDIGLGSGGAPTHLPPATRAPNTVSVNNGGNSGSGPAGVQVSFKFTYHDSGTANGALNLAGANAAFTNGGTMRCLVQWQPPYTFLLGQSGTPTTTLGATQYDSYCTVTLQQVEYPTSDPTAVSITYIITFTSYMLGNWSVNAESYDYQNAWTPWGNIGGWSTTSAPTETITSTPTSTSFTVDSNPYTGTAVIAPQGGGSTIDVPQFARPSNGSTCQYSFWMSDGSLGTQFLPVPPVGETGGDTCPWHCNTGNNTCLGTTPIGPPHTAPHIDHVDDASGHHPAILVPGVQGHITITGTNFGGTKGFLTFCRPSGNSCGSSDNNGLTYGVNDGDWSDTEIVASVTLPDGDGSIGSWAVYVTGIFLIAASDHDNPSLGNLEADQVAMKLERVGPTTINTGNNYSEDTTIRVTAVYANAGTTVSDFRGSVNIAEDGTTIYAQHTDLGADLPPTIVITSGGTVTFIAKSLAGPKLSGMNGQPPDSAVLKTTNYPLSGSKLEIPQWIISNTQIDPRAADMSSTFDWYQTRARDVYNASTGDLRDVLDAVINYTLDGSLPSGRACQTLWVRGGKATYACNPYTDAFRVNSDGGPYCGNTRSAFMTNSIYHESRHAYQGLLAVYPQDDGDGDFLIKNPAPIAPTSVFQDTATARDVCRISDNTIVKDKQYKGDSTVDTPDAPDFASYAWEMDAFLFAARF